MKIKEKSTLIEVYKKYDVSVVGGGIAGIAAAIAAVRNGARVCLIEKNCACGGLATLGNVNVYLPLCDGRGNQVISGLAEEFIKLSISDGYGRIPDCWLNDRDIESRKKFRLKVEFNPWTFALELEKLLVKEGIEILYDTRFCTTVKKHGAITHLILENKSGRFAIQTESIVDASGDADVCFAAGEDVVGSRKNVACGWFFYFDGKQVKKRIFSHRYDPYNRKTYGNRGFSVDEKNGTTMQILSSRKNIKQLIEKMKIENPVLYPVSLPSISTFRMTRRLKGQTELKETDEGKKFSDAVGMCGDWRKPGPIYYIPFSSLYAVKTTNLITAGRCISAKSAWDIVRAIPVCCLTGEIAGTASAFLQKNKEKKFSSLNLKKLRQVLINQGVIID